MAKRRRHQQLELLDEEPRRRKGGRPRKAENRRITEAETARLWWLGMAGMDDRLSASAYQDEETYPLRKRA